MEMQPIKSQLMESLAPIHELVNFGSKCNDMRHHDAFNELIKLPNFSISQQRIMVTLIFKLWVDFV